MNKVLLLKQSFQSRKNSHQKLKFVLLQPSKTAEVMTFSHEIKCTRNFNTESRSHYLFFLFSVQEVTPKSNDFLFFLFIVGRKCCISRTERKHVGMTKHKNRAYTKLQTLHIHKAPSCTVCHSTGSPHWSIFVSPSPKSIQPRILHQTAAICVLW